MPPRAAHEQLCSVSSEGWAQGPAGLATLRWPCRGLAGEGAGGPGSLWFPCGVVQPAVLREVGTPRGGADTVCFAGPGPRVALPAIVLWVMNREQDASVAFVVDATPCTSRIPRRPLSVVTYGRSPRPAFLPFPWTPSSSRGRDPLRGGGLWPLSSPHDGQPCAQMSLGPGHTTDQQHIENFLT